MQEALDLDGASLLPLLHEVADLIGFREPDDRMHMVGHDNESEAPPSLQGQLRIQHAEDDLLGPVVVEQPTPSVARERHEMGVAFPVISPLPGHHKSLRLPG